MTVVALGLGIDVTLGGEQRAEDLLVPAHAERRVSGQLARPVQRRGLERLRLDEVVHEPPGARRLGRVGEGAADLRALDQELARHRGGEHGEVGLLVALPAQDLVRLADDRNRPSCNGLRHEAHAVHLRAGHCEEHGARPGLAAVGDDARH